MHEHGITKQTAILIIALVILAIGGVAYWQLVANKPDTTNTAANTNTVVANANTSVDEGTENTNSTVDEVVNTNESTETTETSNQNTNTQDDWSQATEYPFGDLIQDYLAHGLRVGIFIMVDGVVTSINDDMITVGASASATTTVPMVITDETASVPYTTGQSFVIYFKVTAPDADPILATAGQPSAQ